MCSSAAAIICYTALTCAMGRTCPRSHCTRVRRRMNWQAHRAPSVFARCWAGTSLYSPGSRAAQSWAGTCGIRTV
uniref:Putative secreted protein n=1 Tax=Anopheles darlingi TaxID=43151 RepID=A0A2M4DPV9_ANODA